MAITRPNQVWSTDITYIRLTHGFAYLVAVMDWYSRRVLSWRVSNTLDAGFCVDCLEEALRVHGRPEIFNTDQGSQFTSEAFTKVLLEADIATAKDGRGRALDTIFVERLWRTLKYEDIYLRGYGGLPELLLGLTEYFAFYNGERPHQGAGRPHSGSASRRSRLHARSARASPPRRSSCPAPLVSSWPAPLSCKVSTS